MKRRLVPVLFALAGLAVPGFAWRDRCRAEDDICFGYR